MSRRRLKVLACLLNRVTRQYGSCPTSDLLGVCYRYAVPPDTEFPHEVARLDLFVRFQPYRLGPTRVRVRIVRLDPDGSDMERVSAYSFVVPFAPTDAVRDHVFRLVSIRLPGPGVYAVRVGRRLRGWSGPRWQTLGTDYFLVER